MPVFFNGRQLVTPTTASVVNDTAMANQNLTVGNVLAIIGKAAGGAPLTAMRFGSPSEAQARLRSGDLLDAILAGFAPSPETGGPSLIIGMRIDPAQRASRDLLDAGGTPVIGLQSEDYGLWTNGIKVKIESGTTIGKKVTVQSEKDYYTEDNIARRALQIRYEGEELTATMAVSGSTLTLSAPTGSLAANIDLTVYDTVQKVVDRINVVTDFTAIVLDGNGEAATLNALDYVAAQDVKTANYVVTAHLQAIIDWINGTGEGFVTAERKPNVGAVPANVPFTYLTGGSDGSATVSDWSDAFGALQAEDVQWILPASSDPAVHSMAVAHCDFMSNQGRKERRAFVGTALGTSDDDAVEAAKLLNHDRVGLVHLGTHAFDQAGKLKLYAPYITAARIAGGFAGSNPGTPMTRKALSVLGVERRLRDPTDTDLLLKGGVIPIMDTPTGFRVAQSISTWLTNGNYNRREISTGTALDFVVRNVRDRLDLLVGSRGDPDVIGRAIADTASVLTELARPAPSGPGTIVGDADNPAFLPNIKASLAGDVLRVEFQCSPVVPLNYILVTVNAVPYSGTATAATA